MKVRLTLIAIITVLISSQTCSAKPSQKPGTPPDMIDNSTASKSSISKTKKSRKIRPKDIITGSLMEPFNDPTTDMEFVPVRGGCFKMGDISNEGFFFEKPVHDACVNDFYIGMFEVTQIEWKSIMGENPSHFKDCGDNCPVENVSWDDVQKYIKKLNKKSRLKYRLPTESEWEYAARSGGKEERYSGGNDDPDLFGWHKGNSEQKSHPVGLKKPNALDIYDMSGNVWEWVLDRFGNYSPHKVYNTMGPKEGDSRVFRGGGWYHPEMQMRTASRYYNSPSIKLEFTGFRLAVSARDFNMKRKPDAK